MPCIHAVWRGTGGGRPLPPRARVTRGASRRAAPRTGMRPRAHVVTHRPGAPSRYGSIPHVCTTPRDTVEYMAGVLHVRVPEPQLERWRAVAESAGFSLAEFVRRAVEDKIADRSSAAIARAVSRDLLPEIERMLAMHTVTGEPQSASGSFEIPLAAVPRSFDRGCFDAELHKPGIVCQGCGGSTY